MKTIRNVGNTLITETLTITYNQNEKPTVSNLPKNKQEGWDDIYYMKVYGMIMNQSYVIKRY